MNMKLNIVSSLLLCSLLTACDRGNNDDNEQQANAVAEIPANEKGDTTLYLSYTEEDPVAYNDLLAGVDVKGKQAFIVEPRCQADPETGETYVDENDKEILIPERGLLMRGNIMEINPSVWDNEVKYTVDGPEEIIYTCTYKIDNFATQEIKTVVELEDGSTKVEIDKKPIYAERNVELKIIAKEHVAEGISVTLDPEIEIPLSHTGFSIDVLKVLPEIASIKEVTYTSDNPDIVEVTSETGKVTPKGLGTATITISTLSTNSPITETRVIHVVDNTSKPIGATFITSNNEPISTLVMQEKTSLQMAAQALFQNGQDTSTSNKNILFISLDENRATIDENGLLTAKDIIGTVKVMAIAEEQGFVGLLTVNIQGDPSLFKSYNSDFETGVFGAHATWQEYAQPLSGIPTPQTDEVVINETTPIDGVYDVKIVANDLLAFRQGGLELRLIKPEDGDANADDSLQAVRLTNGSYTLSYDANFTSNKDNNNAHLWMWYEGEYSDTGPTSITDPYYTNNSTKKYTKWGGLNENTTHIEYDFEITGGNKLLYKIVLFSNTTAVGNSFTWHVDNIQLIKHPNAPE